MKTADFNDLIESVSEAGAYLRGEVKTKLRTDRIEASNVAAIRARLHLSQPQFARLLGVGLGTLRHWEQGSRQPTGAARVLLQVASKHPKAVLEAVA